MMQRAIRHPRRVQVKFWPDGQPEHAYAGYSRNISATGMFIATAHPYRPGTLLEIELRGGESAFRMRAEVVHSAKVSPLLQSVRPSGMGVRFQSRSAELGKLLPEEERKTLSELEANVFPRYFSEAEELIGAFERDIRNGGLFVPTGRPPELEEHVTVELHLPRAEDPVLTFAARVVHRVETGEERGMGIAFDDLDDVIERLGPLVDSFR